MAQGDQGSVRNEAMVTPGNGIGQLTITNDYTQVAGGDLRIELRDSGFDRLIVGNAVALGGDLHLLLKQSTPLSRKGRTLVTAASVTGVPAVSLGALPPALWKVAISATSVRLVPK